MSFWTVLCLALGVLWLQALVIQLSALHALRARLRARWGALIALERLCLSRILEDPGVFSQGYGLGVDGEALRGWREGMEGLLLPEDPAALCMLRNAAPCVDRAWMEMGGRWREAARLLGIPGLGGTLYLRLNNAREAFEEAVRAYELRRAALGMERVVAWFGYKPHSTVGRTPKVG